VDSDRDSSPGRANPHERVGLCLRLTADIDASCIAPQSHLNRQTELPLLTPTYSTATKRPKRRPMFSRYGFFIPTPPLNFDSGKNRMRDHRGISKFLETETRIPASYAQIGVRVTVISMTHPTPRPPLGRCREGGQLCLLFVCCLMDLPLAKCPRGSRRGGSQCSNAFGQCCRKRTTLRLDNPYSHQ
jgi:hypothetical protein